VIFLEGPFFTEKYKGAQNPNYFLDPSIDDFTHWQELACGQIKKIALAPEREGARAFIKHVTEQGVQVGIAHTDASYACCVDATDHGANLFIHLFNCMSGLHHRNPGVAGAALVLKRAFAELICDGHHVHPDVATLAYEQKQEKLVLITDCMRAGLLEDGNYMLGEFDVTMKDGIARMDNGALAGSTLKLIDGVKNLARWSGAPLHDIWHLASLSPAKSLGLDATLGSIAPGKLADFVVIDEDFNVKAAAVAGEIKYRA
jgi:N-acetylglucosamine-6-phosphate deacetylase